MQAETGTDKGDRYYISRDTLYINVTFILDETNSFYNWTEVHNTYIFKHIVSDQFV